MKEKVIKIAEYFDLKDRLKKLAEECSELSVAALHGERHGLTQEILENLIEEMADVKFMLEQLTYKMTKELNLDIGKLVRHTEEFKADRTIELIEKKTKDNIKGQISI